MVSSLLIVLLVIVHPAVQTDSYIDWTPTEKLTWADFQGPVDASSTNAALTSANIKLDLGYDKDGFHYQIYCRFNKARSWVRVKNDYILAHEQGHFDISEIFARRLHKAFKDYRYNHKTIEQDMQRIYGKIVQDHQAMQLQYDAETDHSRNTEQQKRWLASIKKQLDELAAYADYGKQ